MEYFGSYKKDGTFNPTEKIILQTFKTRKEANEAEIILHNFYEVGLNPHFANKAKATSAGFTTAGMKHGPESREKMSKVRKGRKLSEKHKERIGIASSNRSDETKQKLSKAAKGKKKTEEHKLALSKALMGRVFSKETRQKMSDAHKGKKQSKEAVAKRTGSCYYNNGEICKMYKEGIDEIPKDFVKGRLSRKIKE